MLEDRQIIELYWQKNADANRRTSTFPSRSGSARTKRWIASRSSLASYAASVSAPPPKHSPSSSRTRAISPPPRFSAFRALNRSKERLRVIFARNSRSMLGFCGGIAFQA